MRLWVLARMFDNKRFRKCAIFSGIVSFMFVSYMAYLYHHDNSVVAINRAYTYVDSGYGLLIRDRSLEVKQLSFSHQQMIEETSFRRFSFDIDSNEVIVFLHIQKTGGTTFGRHLVNDLKVDPPCKCQTGRKRCKCLNTKNQAWLVSRYSTGWVCGLHADWTELHECVNDALNKREPARERVYLYITILREPTARYISEWMHVQRGATWMASQLRCKGHAASLDEVPLCYSGGSWEGVSLEEFMGCSHNLANNRQTRMLADLTLVNCYNRSGSEQADRQRDAAILASAKRNLASLAFFGLTEFQVESQWLFERTFGLHFTSAFVQFNETRASDANLTLAQVKRLHHVNALDEELYDYARQLFFHRLAAWNYPGTGGAVEQPRDDLPLHLPAAAGTVGQRGVDMGGRSQQQQQSSVLHRLLDGEDGDSHRADATAAEEEDNWDTGEAAAAAGAGRKSRDNIGNNEMTDTR